LDSDLMVSTARPSWTVLLSPLLRTPESPTIHIHRGDHLPAPWKLQPGNVYALGLDYAIVSKRVLRHRKQVANPIIARTTSRQSRIRIGLAAGSSPSVDALYNFGLLWKSAELRGEQPQALVSGLDHSSLAQDLDSVGVSLSQTQFAGTNDPWHLLKGADILVTAGGQSLIEASVIGIPFAAAPALPAQVEVAQRLEDLGAGRILPIPGPDSRRVVNEILDWVCSEVVSPTASKAPTPPLDGKGAWRATRLIRKTVLGLAGSR